MQNVPPQVQEYLTNEYLINYSNYEIAINKLIECFQYEQFPLPRESIKDFILFLEDQEILSPKLIEDTLHFLDISLSFITSETYELDSIKLSQNELFIIHKYFYHPEGHAVNILSHAIRLSPSVSTTILELFLPKKNYQGFNQVVTNIFRNNFFKSLFPILELIFYLSDKQEIVILLTDIYQALISKIPTLECSEQAISFKILFNFCKADKKFYSILYNNNDVKYLYSQITDRESLNAGFEFICLISDEENYQNPLDFIERLKIESSVKFAIKDLREEAIKLISIAFYNIISGNNAAVDYFLEKGFLNLFLSLESKVSFSVWQHVMEMICIVVLNSDMPQLEYIINNSETVLLIAQMTENVDPTLDQSQQDLSEVINGVLQQFFDIAKLEFDKNKKMIFSQELREQLQESALFEYDNKYQPITNFINSIDHLYNPELDDIF